MTGELLTSIGSRVDIIRLPRVRRLPTLVRGLGCPITLQRRHSQRATFRVRHLLRMRRTPAAAEARAAGVDMPQRVVEAAVVVAERTSKSAETLSSI